MKTDDDELTVRRQQRQLADVLLQRAASGDVPAPPPHSDATKLFIVGCPRSGTTWVRQLVGRHPATVSGSETHLYQDVFQPFVQPGRPAAWRKVLWNHERYRLRGTRGHVHAWVDLGDFHDLVVRAMASPKASDEEVGEDLAAEIYDTICATHGVTADRVLIDKTPWHLRHARRILKRFPEAKVIEVLRDGRDVCVSMEKLDREWVPHDRTEQIERWAEAARLGLELRADPDVADRVHLARYEALKADPVGEVRAMYDFIGLEHTDTLVENTVASADFSTHGRTGDGNFFRKGVVGDWRNAFSAEDEALFREKVGPLLVEAGYEY